MPVQDVGDQAWYPHTSGYLVDDANPSGGLLSWAISEALKADEAFQQVRFPGPLVSLYSLLACLFCHMCSPS